MRIPLPEPPNEPFDDSDMPPRPGSTPGGPPPGSDGTARTGRRYAVAPQQVAERLAAVLAGLDGADGATVEALTRRTRHAAQVWEAAGGLAAGWQDLIDLLAAEVSMSGADAPFGFATFECAAALSPDGAAALAAVRVAQPARQPLVAWQGLTEQVARAEAVAAHEQLGRAAGQLSQAELVRRQAELPSPTTLPSSGDSQMLRSSADYQRELDVSPPPVRLSSGMRLLDRLVTAPGRPLGFISPGEGVVVGGMTGSGKTSMSYTITLGLHRHLKLVGSPDATSILFFTEQEGHERAGNLGLLRGGANEQHAAGMLFADVNNSRQAIVACLYEAVAAAEDRAADTGRPIVDFAPWVVHLDYLQAIVEPGESEAAATKRTAELMHRGVQKLDPHALAQFGGVSYEAHTGRAAWPAGLEGHRIAGVYYVQYRKQDGGGLLYDPDRSALKDFTLPADEGGGDAWLGPDGNHWLWEVRPGDMRILQFSEIRGHGEITQAADTVLTLHRSRPYGNPSRQGHDGSWRLTDTRARVIVQKARRGQFMQVADLRFDVAADGSHARYWDDLADRSLARFDEQIAAASDPEQHARLVAQRRRRDGRSTWRRPGDFVFPDADQLEPLTGSSYIDR